LLLRYVGMIQLLFFIRPNLYLIGPWFSEDHKTNIIKKYVRKKLNYIFKILLDALSNLNNYSKVNNEL
jgi:hypothetical protein